MHPRFQIIQALPLDHWQFLDQDRCTFVHFLNDIMDLTTGTLDLALCKRLVCSLDRIDPVEL